MPLAGCLWLIAHPLLLSCWLAVEVMEFWGTLARLVRVL